MLNALAYNKLKLDSEYNYLIWLFIDTSIRFIQMEKTMKKATLIILLFVFGMASFSLCSAEAGKKKILYVDSYHPEYESNIMARERFADGINKMNIEVRYVYMDAKHKKSEALQKLEALRIKEIITQWQPDLIVAADDPANKYLIVPYYKGSAIPIIFNGVNWNVSDYDYPAKNITGQIEVELMLDLISKLKSFSRGNRIGILTGDTLTDRKSLKVYSEVLNLNFDQVSLVNSFDDWKTQFLNLQKSVDILIIRNDAGISGWDDDSAKQFTNENSSIPSGTIAPFMKMYTLICYPKLKEEFGEISARMTNDILFNGKSPAQIPIVTNKNSRIYLNMKIAKKLGVTFPIEMIENAHLISAEQKKLLYVNSYHKGYQWSDDIEKGLLKALGITTKPDGTFDTSKSEVEFKIFRMDSNRNVSEESKKHAALSAKTIIDEWQPDIVVTSDDNAAKYLILPYYMKSAIPFVFCGLNWDASAYGFPTPNVTGMVEIEPVLDTIAMLKMYARGNRIGVIGADLISQQKTIENYEKKLGVVFTKKALVSTFSEWQMEYLKLQNSVDILLWLSPVGIKDWNEKLARDVIFSNTKIPTGSTGDHNKRYVLLGKVKLATEQGWWAGKTALRIIKGTNPANIIVTTNKESIVLLNMELAKQMGIKFPMELIKKATFVDNPSD